MPVFKALGNHDGVSRGTVYTGDLTPKREALLKRGLIELLEVDEDVDAVVDDVDEVVVESEDIEPEEDDEAERGRDDHDSSGDGDIDAPTADVRSEEASEEEPSED